MPHTPHTILITGAAGFVGRGLAVRLASEFPDAEIIGVDLAGIDDVSPLDITDRDAVDAFVARRRPDCVLHLAAQSHVPTAFADPAATWRVNMTGTLNLFEAVRRDVPGGLFIYVSTAEIYGTGFNAGRPAGEGTAFGPMNPYAASKAAADAMLRDARDEGQHVVVLRPFNHVGPGQRRDFVVSSFCSQIARIEQGLQEPVISVGNLDAKRDFLDVRDVIDAYVRVVRHGRDHPSGTAWNLCSGRTVTIRSVLNDLLDMSSVDIEVRIDPDRLRPSDVPEACGDACAARDALGWEPATPWSVTLADTLEYWRSITKD